MIPANGQVYYFLATLILQMHLSYKPLYQLPRAIHVQKFGWGKLVIFASGQSFHNILPGVRTPQGLYEAWWDEPQQWTSLLLSLHSDFPNAFPGICGCVKVCSRYCTNCQGQFMHNKSGVLSPCGPCGAWWSRALVAGTLDKCTPIQIEWRDH